MTMVIVAMSMAFADDKQQNATTRIPTTDELNAVMPDIRELTSEDFAALKAKKKTHVEVADALLSYISEGDNPAAKYLLRQRAFRQYILGAAFDKATALYTAVRNESGIEYALEIAKGQQRKMNGKKDEKATALKERIEADKNAMKNIAAIKAKLAQAPADGKLNEQLGVAYVVCGDWEAALSAFRNCTGEMAKVAKWESSDNKSTDYDAVKVAKFWWAFADEKSRNKLAAESIKVHAANWYKKAFALNLLSGLEAKIAERRIDECGSLGTQAVVKERVGKLYMVIDLTKLGKKAISYLDETPKNGWGDEYKTTKIVLRRIAPGSFEYLPGKSFKITKPFYIGVFEVTQKQYEITVGENPSRFKGDMRPVEMVWYSRIRGKVKGLNWPKDNQVDNDSYLGKLRKKIGLEFDLPTEVQWEYACRAGTTGDYNVEDVDLRKIARVRANGGEEGQHAKVGSYLPNAWGLYDMHGNVAEWCLDRAEFCTDKEEYGRRESWTADVKETETDPKGASTGNAHIFRGGNFGTAKSSLRSSFRAGTWERGPSLGFRLACPADSAK